jgi:hypothetical protein
VDEKRHDGQGVDDGQQGDEGFGVHQCIVHWAVCWAQVNFLVVRLKLRSMQSVCSWLS